MDLGTSIAGLALVAVIFLPFVVMAQNQKRKINKFDKQLADFALQNNCLLTEHELLNHIAIGIDGKNKQLFFINITPNAVVQENINLNEIQKCRISNNGRSVNTKVGNANVTDKLLLTFLRRDNKAEQNLELFNTDNGGLSLKGELQLAEKWVKIINATIASK